MKKTPQLDNSFHTKVLSLVKVFEPKISNLHITPISKRIPIYNSKIIFNNKREMLFLLDYLMYDFKLLDRLNNKRPLISFSISENYKKVSISVPIIEVDEVATYSLNNNLNFEIKTINLNIDFHLKYIQ